MYPFFIVVWYVPVTTIDNTMAFLCISLMKINMFLINKAFTTQVLLII
jgi:hypothetical protein